MVCDEAEPRGLAVLAPTLCKQCRNDECRLRIQPNISRGEALPTF